MKLKLMIVAFVMLFIAGLQVKAQDPCIHEDGSTGVTATFIYPYSYTDEEGTTHDCEYTVKVCVTCSVVQHQFRLDLIEITASPGCSIVSGAYYAILNYLLTEACYREICGSDIPPCPDTKITEVVDYNCLERGLIIHGNFPDDYWTEEVLMVCPDSPYCVHHYEECFNEETGQYERRNETFTSYGGVPTCPDNDWENPVYGTCLNFGTPCDN